VESGRGEERPWRAAVESGRAVCGGWCGGWRCLGWDGKVGRWFEWCEKGAHAPFGGRNHVKSGQVSSAQVKSCSRVFRRPAKRGWKTSVASILSFFCCATCQQGHV
jgi:hypothetical protein